MHGAARRQPTGPVGSGEQPWFERGTRASRGAARPAAAPACPDERAPAPTHRPVPGRASTRRCARLHQGLCIWAFWLCRKILPKSVESSGRLLLQPDASWIQPRGSHRRGLDAGSTGELSMRNRRESDPPSEQGLFVGWLCTDFVSFSRSVQHEPSLREVRRSEGCFFRLCRLCGARGRTADEL